MSEGVCWLDISDWKPHPDTVWEDTDWQGILPPGSATRGTEAMSADTALSKADHDL